MEQKLLSEHFNTTTFVNLNGFYSQHPQRIRRERFCNNHPPQDFSSADNWFKAGRVMGVDAAGRHERMCEMTKSTYFHLPTPSRI